MSILADRASNIGIFFDFSKHASKNLTIHDRWQPSPNTVSHPSRVLKIIPSKEAYTPSQASESQLLQKKYRTRHLDYRGAPRNSWVLKQYPTETGHSDMSTRVVLHTRVLKIIPTEIIDARYSQEKKTTGCNLGVV